MLLLIYITSTCRRHSVRRSTSWRGRRGGWQKCKRRRRIVARRGRACSRRSPGRRNIVATSSGSFGVCSLRTRTRRRPSKSRKPRRLLWNIGCSWNLWSSVFSRITGDRTLRVGHAYKSHCNHSTRSRYFAEIIVSVWNSLPTSVNFVSLSGLKNSPQQLKKTFLKFMVFGLWKKR